MLERKTPFFLVLWLAVLIPLHCDNVFETKVVFLEPACPPRFHPLPYLDAGVRIDAGSLDIDLDSLDVDAGVPPADI